MKRSYALILALVAIPLAMLVATAQTPPPPTATPPAATPPAATGPSRGTAVFNVPKVMRDYQKWQYFAAEVNKDRMEKAGMLAKKQKEGLEPSREKMKVEVNQGEKEKMAQQLIVLQRTLEGHGEDGPQGSRREAR